MSYSNNSDNCAAIDQQVLESDVARNIRHQKGDGSSDAFGDAFPARGPICEGIVDGPRV